jgi:amino acid adenylation domain-containing protein
VAEPATSSVAEGVRAIARRDPDRPALAGTGRPRTFAELDREIDSVVEVLVAAGVHPGRFVTVELDRDVEAIIAVLSLWRLGAAYVPIDPTSPTPHRDALLDQAGQMVTHRLVPEPAAARGWSIRPGPSTPGPAVPTPPDGSDTAAYAIFTSGTAGRRRLVVVGHRQVAHLIEGLSAAVFADLDPAASPVGMCGPLSFDTSIKQLTRIGAGHPIVVVPPAARAEPSALASHVRRHGVAVLDAAPRVAQRWLREGVLDGPGGPLVRRLLVGGEAIDAVLWRALAQVEDMTAFNLYGPTECTVDTTVARIEGPFAHLGRPLAGCAVEVVDGDDEAAPPYVVGELVISGAGLAWGYAGRDQAGFGERAGRRCYRTGDLARRHPDGTFEFIGRADLQAKSAGARVDLSEVEAALRSVAGVDEAAAAVGDDGSVVAIVTAYAGSTVDGDSVRHDLATRFPLAFVPATVAVRPRIPLTDRGKTDRAAVARAGYDPGGEPIGALEQLVAEIMAEVAGGAPFLRDESFFRRGGDSLGILEVAGRLAEVVSSEVDISQLVASPTPRAVAAHLPPAGGGSGDAAPTELDPEAGGAPRAPNPTPPFTLAPRPVVGAADPEPTPAQAGCPGTRSRSATSVRSLADAIACGAIGGLDAAALNCVPDVARSVLGRGDELRSFMGGFPLLAQVRRTELGALGVILLPCYVTEAASVAPDQLDAAIRLAATFGARAVSLTGELAPATDLGRAFDGRVGSPLMTTGQASTVAAMLATWETALAATGRRVDGERLAVAGSGPLTASFLAAVERGAATPAATDRFDPTSGAGVERARLATSVVVTGIADLSWIDALEPETVVVEYGTGLGSAPSAPSGDQPWILSGGTLTARRPIDDLTHLDPRLHDVSPALVAEVLEGNERSIAACALAASLVAVGDAPRTVGPATPELVDAYRSAHRRWGFEPTLSGRPSSPATASARASGASDG